MSTLVGQPPPSERMKALVLIGGFGTRLRPITYAVPKQLIPIAGKAMLYHVLDLLPPEVDEAVLATGYKSEAIEAYVRSEPPGLPVRTVKETTPLGTGGGMRNAGDTMTDPFVLLNSDVIAEVNVAGMIAQHRERKGVGTMSLYEVEDTRPYGVAALGEQDRIVRFVEKPEPANAPSHWINAGVSVWDRDVIEKIPTGRPVSFETEILPGLLSVGVFGYKLPAFWEDAGTPERLLHAQRLLFDAGRGVDVHLPSGAEGQGPVSAGEGSIARGASFGGYVTLGADVRVEPLAHLEDAVVMEGAVIGANAVVAHALVGPKAVVPPGQRIEGTIWAPNAEPPKAT
ncbi:MAG: NDP-sugar synthase [Thermoplasmata archaeon]|nr:NDP-sugar synthase [Thermoplasmata archaeon]